MSFSTKNKDLVEEKVVVKSAPVAKKQQSEDDMIQNLLEGLETPE